MFEKGGYNQPPPLRAKDRPKFEGKRYRMGEIELNKACQSIMFNS